MPQQGQSVSDSESESEIQTGALVPDSSGLAAAVMAGVDVPGGDSVSNSSAGEEDEVRGAVADTQAGALVSASFAPAPGATPSQAERGEVIINADSNSEEIKYSKFVYYTSFGVMIACNIVEFGYEGFVYKYNEKSLSLAAGYIAKKDPSDVKGFSIPTAGTITAVGTGADLLLVNPKAEALALAEMFPNGFVSGIGSIIKAKFTKLPYKCFTRYPAFNATVTFAIPSLLMLSNFMIGAYGDYEAIQPWLKKNAPYLAYPAMAAVLFLGTAYYTVGTAKDNYDGIDFILNQGKARLDHPETKGKKPQTMVGPQTPQKTVWGHIKDKNIATVLQLTIEAVSANILSRPIGFGFLAAQILRQNSPVDENGVTTVDDNTIAIAQAFGILTTIAAAYPARYPSSYCKFLGNADSRLDLVTQEERDQAYQDKYAGNTWTKFKSEVKRLLHPLALAESLLAGYGGYALGRNANGWTGINDWTQKDTETQNISSTYGLLYILPVLSAAMFGIAVYAGIYRAAYLRRELNQHAINEGFAKAPEHVRRVPVVAENSNKQAQPTEANASTLIATLATLFVVANFISRGLNGIYSALDNKVLQKGLPSMVDLVTVATATNVIPLINGADYYYGKVSTTMYGLGNACLFKQKVLRGTQRLVESASQLARRNVLPAEDNVALISAAEKVDAPTPSQGGR